MTPRSKQLSHREMNQRPTWRDADVGEMPIEPATDEAMQTAMRAARKETQETDEGRGQPAIADRTPRGQPRKPMNYETILVLAPGSIKGTAKPFQPTDARRIPGRAS